MSATHHEDPRDAIIAWFLSGGSGRSAKTIVAALTGQEADQESHPLDAADFGRCHRLLQAVPSFRERIGEMRHRSPEWAALVESWSDLETLYEADQEWDPPNRGMRSQCDVRLRAILDSVREGVRGDQ